jgi:hypothetical protein
VYLEMAPARPHNTTRIYVFFLQEDVMRATKIAMLLLALVAFLLLAGCAVSPEDESRQRAIEADIDAILSQPGSPEMGAMQRCLSDIEFRHYRALDEKHMLFEGRNNRLWINTLHNRCPDLRWGDTLVVRQFSGMRVCDGDRFYVTEWFDWPWYRRWPWHWGSHWGTGMQCILGKFQPVTADQVAEIEAVLRAP